MAERRWRGIVAMLTVLIALSAVNLSIARKERLLAHGQVVCLELAPLDRRSIMQGDYMSLNYRVADEITRLLPHREPERPWLPELEPADGRVVVTLEQRAVATFARLDDGRPLAVLCRCSGTLGLWPLGHGPGPRLYPPRRPDRHLGHRHQENGPCHKTGVRPDARTRDMS